MVNIAPQAFILAEAGLQRSIGVVELGCKYERDIKLAITRREAQRVFGRISDEVCTSLSKVSVLRSLLDVSETHVHPELSDVRSAWRDHDTKAYEQTARWDNSNPCTVRA